MARVFLFLFVLSAHAASLIPTTASDSFPQCAVDCAVLQQAQDSCTAGAESSWVSCFCESALLTSLKSSGNICTSCTSTADQSLLSSWYNNYCRSGGSKKAPGNAATTTTTSDTTTAAATTGPTTTASSANANHASVAEEHPSCTHYQWVIMLIVLAVAFSIIAVLGVWLKRRYDARHAQLYPQSNSANASGVLGSSAGVLTPAPVAYGTPAGPGQAQSRSLAPDSLASSSRTDIAPKGAPLPPNRLRSSKLTQSPAADVEIRQISRS
ncbi:hypothetical protein N7492_001927 [Penicillium capsulatum]|uniref:CFEM domain-containing protein n=1 Tax=Penicillium capsulatum TaxID=69766 RepID=A0A9W9LVV5_9EURO|nr:hypothetical protein N7492_001927 [Penicillium capsulatum]